MHRFFFGRGVFFFKMDGWTTLDGGFSFCRYQSPFSFCFFLFFFLLTLLFRYVLLCMGGLVRVGVILFPFPFSFFYIFLRVVGILPFDRIHYSDLSILFHKYHITPIFTLANSSFFSFFQCTVFIFRPYDS